MAASLQIDNLLSPFPKNQLSGKLFIKLWVFLLLLMKFLFKEAGKFCCHKIFVSIGEIPVMIFIVKNLVTLHEIFRSSRKGNMVLFYLLNSRIRMHGSLNLLNPTLKKKRREGGKYKLQC